MWPDLGMPGAGKAASPMTCTPGTSLTSAVSQFTPTQRSLTRSEPIIPATAPARCGGMMLSTSALTVSNSITALREAASTSSKVLSGRYSMIPR